MIAGINIKDTAGKYSLNLVSNLIGNIGIAILVSNIFSFILGTNEFLSYIRERLMDIVISKDFIARLNPEEQKKFLSLALKPSREISKIYSGVDDYFEQYIKKSMSLFDTCYRGHLVLNVVASFNKDRNVLQAECDLNYLVYKVAEKFDPLRLLSDDDQYQHIETFVSSGGKRLQLKPTSNLSAEDLKKTCSKSGTYTEIPDEFNSFKQISVQIKVIEFGNDHWQVFSYKTIKPTDRVQINIKCEDDIIIRKCDTYGVQEDFDIAYADDNRSIKVTYNDWLEPGFGVNFLLAKKDN